MRAVTFQAPGEVRVDEKPDPEVGAGDEALVRVEASGICGSDLHIFHGRVPVEPGFTIGHEFVGTVLAAGPDVERVAVGDRVLGCFHTACATCAACLRSDYHRCERGQTFGHGAQLAAIARAVRRNYAGFSAQRPLASFLFVGPSGVGKTETARVLAEEHKAIVDAIRAFAA